MYKLIITEPFKTQIITVKKKSPTKENALIKPLYVGICGTDLEVFKGKYEGTKYPETRGHEFIGRVKEVVLNDYGIKNGDIVLINPNISCGRCDYCKNEKDYLCNSLKVLGAKGVDGAMQEELVVPIENLIKVPGRAKDMTLNLVLSEPLSVSIHSLRLTELGNKILLYGLGSIGTLSLIYLKGKYSKEISAVEIDKKNIRKDVKKNLEQVYDHEDIDKNIKKLEEKFDSILINCPYDTRDLNVSIRIIKKGGKIIIVGRPKEKICLDFITVLFKEISIFNSFKNTKEDFKLANNFLKGTDIRRYLDLKIFHLKEAQAAFDFKLKNPNYKVVLKLDNSI
jgi:threonine dehydrogenase-like Zn-dependent dehydrogenase